MAREIVARRQGDDFQARLFWLNALCLLIPHSNVIRVAYETGPRGFDDVLVEYDPQAAPPDHEGQPFLRRHMQCKWHTTAGTFGYADLINPAFINAQARSFLERAHDAQRLHAPDGLGCRFELVTNWRLAADDPLLRLVRKENNSLDLARLFDDTTDRSRMGQVRKLWREHLDIDDAGLRTLVRTLSIREVPESLSDLREHLNDRLAAAGLEPVPASESGFAYDDLVAKLFAQGQGRVAFDRDSFLEMARDQGILAEQRQAVPAPVIGIRSFMHPIDNLEDRCARLLNLVPYFDGRYVRNDADWQEHILPGLQQFIRDAARTGDRLRLIIDAHASIAFGTGALLNVKSGRKIEIEQRAGGRHIWALDDVPADPAWPQFAFDEEITGQGEEIALAISLTHDVGAAVSAHVKAALPQTGRIIHCRLPDGASQQAVQSGRHASMLAEAVVQHLRATMPDRSHTHIFLAGPNGFAFFLGQHQQAIGPATGYEFDFDRMRGGGYTPGLSVPERAA